MFVITVGPGLEPAGSIGYWQHTWQGETVWETGWSVLPEFQGQGVATRATVLVVAQYDFEYPPGHDMRCNDWAIELAR